MKCIDWLTKKLSMKKAFKKWLIQNGARDDTIKKWGRYTLEKAWAKCTDPCLMIWIVSRHIGSESWPSHKQLVMTLCLCAELGLIATDSIYTRRAIKITKRWTQNRATIDEVRIAARATRELARRAWHASICEESENYHNHHWPDVHRACAISAAANAADTADNLDAADIVPDEVSDTASCYDASLIIEKQMCDIIRENLSVGKLS